jgi:hypothetical protein
LDSVLSAKKDGRLTTLIQRRATKSTSLTVRNSGFLPQVVRPTATHVTLAMSDQMTGESVSSVKSPTVTSANETLLMSVTLVLRGMKDPTVTSNVLKTAQLAALNPLFATGASMASPEMIAPSLNVISTIVMKAVAQQMSVISVTPDGQEINVKQKQLWMLSAMWRTVMLAAPKPMSAISATPDLRAQTAVQLLLSATFRTVMVAAPKPMSAISATPDLRAQTAVQLLLSATFRTVMVAAPKPMSAISATPDGLEVTVRPKS